MEGHGSTGQSPQWAVVPMEEIVSTITANISQILHQNTQRKANNNDERVLAIKSDFVSVCVGRVAQSV